jgi:uncharacterized protein
MNKRLRHVIIFFILSFVVTWIFYFSIVLFGLDPYQGTGMILLIFGGCSPTVVGIVMALVTYKKAEKKEYFKRFYDLRYIKPLWWIVAILMFPAIIALSIGLDAVLGGTLPEMVNLKAILANPLVWFPLIFLSFMSGPFSEEFGWRGFALSPLLERFGFIKASVLLGFIWGAWHLPLYFMPATWHGSMGFQFEGFWTFILTNIGLSVIMSWVFIHTKRSIFAAMLIHLSANFSTQLIAGSMATGYSPRLELIRTLIILAIAVVLSVYMIVKKKDKALNYAYAEIQK